MTTPREIVDSLLEADPDDVDPAHYLDRYSDQIASDEATGKVTYRSAQDCDTFYHRTVRYKGRGKKPGAPYQARRNGATKTWKTRPGEFRIPIKIGFREYGYIDQSNADEWSTRPDFPEASEDYARQQRLGNLAQLQQAPVKPQPEDTPPPAPPDPNQPELFNEHHSRLRELGLY